MIADALRVGPVMFAWTDGHSHYDFYMIPNDCFKTVIYPQHQRVQRWLEGGQVIVGVEKSGCFNFGLGDGQEFYQAYVAEKLGLDAGSASAGIADLLNRITEHLTPGRKITL